MVSYLSHLVREPSPFVIIGPNTSESISAPRLPPPPPRQTSIGATTVAPSLCIMWSYVRNRALSLSSETIHQWRSGTRSFSSSLINANELLNLEEVQKILTDVRADDVRVIPVTNHSDFTNFVVVATGKSQWHVRNIAQALIYKVKQKQTGAKRMLLPSVEGQERGNWIVIDSGSLIVHALDEKARAYYNLEQLWTSKKPSFEQSQSQDLGQAFVKIRRKNNSKKPAK